MNKKINYAFFGTSLFAVTVLSRLREHDFLPSLLITMPDQRQGRGLTFTSPPVKIWAQRYHVPVFQPETFQNIEEECPGIKNTHVFIVASFGKILPKSILALPPRGVLNIHPSLLPKYRGPSPLQSAILADDHDTGVSIILLDEEMDHGPILAQEHVSITPWPPPAHVFEEKLAKAGGDLLATLLPEWVSGNITVHAQDHAHATYTKKIEKQDGELNLDENAYQNYLKICAFDPWPGTFFFINRREKKIRIKITKASYHDGQLIIERVIPEGGRDMSYQDFLRSQTKI